MRGYQLGLGFLIAALPCAAYCHAQEQSLIGTIVKWRYPGAEINDATMEDGQTIKADGERSAPSVVRKAVFTTPDAIDKVLGFYKKSLSMEGASSQEKPGKEQPHVFPRSVVFHEDSAKRPLTVHIILVNAEKSSTTLVISRASNENETHIAWTQYEKH